MDNYSRVIIDCDTRKGDKSFMGLGRIDLSLEFEGFTNVETVHVADICDYVNNKKTVIMSAKNLIELLTKNMKDAILKVVQK